MAATAFEAAMWIRPPIRPQDHNFDPAIRLPPGGVIAPVRKCVRRNGPGLAITHDLKPVIGNTVLQKPLPDSRRPRAGKPVVVGGVTVTVGMPDDAERRIRVILLQRCRNPGQRGIGVRTKPGPVIVEQYAAAHADDNMRPAALNADAFHAQRWHGDFLARCRFDGCADRLGRDGQCQCGKHGGRYDSSLDHRTLPYALPVMHTAQMAPCVDRRANLA